MDRMGFFKQLVVKGLEVFDNPIIAALEKTARIKERPPGAVTPESKFQELCTGCDACMVACPVNIIFIEDLNTRFPIIYPEETPCLHCTGYPCISACKTGALRI